MTATGRVGMRKLVDEHERGAAFENRVDVHFAKAMALMIDVAARDDLVAVDQRLGLAPAVRLTT